MNTKVVISKESIYILFLFYLIPVLDTFGLLVNNYFPFLIVFRGVTFFLGLYIVLTSNYISLVIKFLIFCLIFYLFTTFLFHFLIFSPESTLEINKIIKLIYFPLTFLALFVLRNNEIVSDLDIEKVIFRYGYLIFLSLFLGYITGFGGQIGGRGTNIEASKGFMIGANEVGLMLILTVPFFFMRLRTRLSVINTSLISLVFYTIGGIMVFTKSSLIALLVVLWYLFINLKDLTSVKRKLVKYILYFCFFWSILYIYANNSLIIEFMMSSFFNSLIEGDIVGFFFRGRQNYIEGIFPQLYESSNNWITYLFGIGEFKIRNLSEMPLQLKPGGGTLFEMDFFDLFAMFGVFGFTLYSILLVVIIKVCRTTNFKLLFVLVFLHAFMAGHVLFSPQVTTLLSFTLIYNIIKK